MKVIAQEGSHMFTGVKGKQFDLQLTRIMAQLFHRYQRAAGFLGGEHHRDARANAMSDSQLVAHLSRQRVQ